MLLIFRSQYFYLLLLFIFFASTSDYFLRYVVWLPPLRVTSYACIFFFSRSERRGDGRRDHTPCFFFLFSLDQFSRFDFSYVIIIIISFAARPYFSCSRRRPVFTLKRDGRRGRAALPALAVLVSADFARVYRRNRFFFTLLHGATSSCSIRVTDTNSF